MAIAAEPSLRTSVHPVGVVTAGALRTSMEASSTSPVCVPVGRAMVKVVPLFVEALAAARKVMPEPPPPPVGVVVEAEEETGDGLPAVSNA